MLGPSSRSPSHTSGTVQALGSEATRTRFENLGAEPAPMPQAGFAQRVASEMETTTGLIRSAGIRAGN